MPKGHPSEISFIQYRNRNAERRVPFMHPVEFWQFVIKRFSMLHVSVGPICTCTNWLQQTGAAYKLIMKFTHEKAANNNELFIPCTMCYGDGQYTLDIALDKLRALR